MTKIGAVIFDMDGVISDTQKFHAQAESKLLRQYGIDLKPEEITQRFAGVSDDEMFKIIFRQNNIAIPRISNLITEKWQMMDGLTKSIKAVPGALNLIKLFHQQGFKLAVASSSPLTFISKVMSQLKISDYFTALVSSDAVSNGKPNPDIFIETARRLSVGPSLCLVIEDGQSGIIGAKRAGMITIAYNLKSPNADFQVKWLSEVVALIGIEEDPKNPC